jgi:Domain of unknown function (DUF4411)
VQSPRCENGSAAENNRTLTSARGANLAGYWLDTDVYLQAALGVLAFDLAPDFWVLLEESAEHDIIGSPKYVCMELVELSGRDDAIKRWAETQRSKGILFHEPDEKVLANYTLIADYVNNNMDQSEGDDFLDGADAWVIAHAMTGGAVAVSQEKLAGRGSKLVKVPNICGHFSVECIKTDQLLRDLKRK